VLIAVGQVIIAVVNWGMVMEVHLSVATIEALNKILRTCRNLRHVIGREPTAEEIARRLRMPPETIRKLLGPPAPLTRH
jgi:DNA-directed RNA polymerase sigma subunit (sigma70/sigma32)